jgi:hypothetical protein
VGVGPVEMARAKIMVRDAFFAVRFGRGARQRFLFIVRRSENAQQRNTFVVRFTKRHGKLVCYNFIKFRKIIK